ncbi:AMP-binding protein [Streptomyces griseochromogenes]|uniref:AMP-binding protein n=1 Tax=Streptomyces griseochromogenes TaxID=68214 RepID=UPI0035588A4E
MENGAGPGRFVAVALPRSAEPGVSLLAVVKPGAAYVPIDPDCPAQRISYIFGDAAPKLLVTRTQLADRPATPGLPAVLLPADAIRRISSTSSAWRSASWA